MTIGGQPAELNFAGGVPYGWSGLLAAMVRIPAGLGLQDPAQLPVVITAGSASIPDSTATLWVRP